MSPLSYAPLRADAAAADNADGDDTSTSPPETLTVSTVAAAAIGGVGHHLLKVEGYSRLKHTHGDTGSYLESGEFTAGGHAWRIHCYLNGEREEDAGFVSLYLKRAGASGGAAGGGVVHAEFDFELVRHHGAAAEWPSRTLRSPFVPFKAGGEWGYPEFIAAGELERSRFLGDDCFAVRCTVIVVEERAAEEEDVTAEDMEMVGSGLRLQGRFVHAQA